MTRRIAANSAKLPVMRRGVRFSDDITDDDASNGVESSCRPNMRRG
jgi:hypothetical protein